MIRIEAAIVRGEGEKKQNEQEDERKKKKRWPHSVMSKCEYSAEEPALMAGWIFA